MVTVFRSKELLDLGIGTDALDCCLKRVRRGWFVLKGQCGNPEHASMHEIHAASQTPYPRRFDDIRDKTEQLKTLIRTYAGEILPDAVFSHVSAAIILGLEPPFPITDQVEIIRPGCARTKATIICRDRVVAPDERVQIGDLSVTSIRRTLLDLAHDHSLEAAVPFISHALREGLVSTDALDDGVRTGGRGCRNAALALALADAKHESAGEALCAVNFFRHGITGMVPQVDSYDRNGEWIARNDFRHETLPLVVEFHGLGKYYLAENGPDRASAKNHERHMKLLNSGLRVFNLVWADLFRAQPFRRIKAELDALAKSRPPLSAETAAYRQQSRR